MSLKRPAIFLFATLAVIARAQDFKQVQTTHTDRAAFAPGGTIRVSASYGDLYVEGWDQPEVEITVIKTMPYNYKLAHPEQAEHHLEQVTIRMERRSDTDLAITTTLPSHNRFLSPTLSRTTTGSVGVEYQVHVPRESRLAIQHGTGYVFVNNVAGDIEASGRRGDLLLMLPGAAPYAIDAKSKFGTVSSDFEGAPKMARYRLGERYLSSGGPSPRHIHLRMGFGGITIKAIPPEALGPSRAK
jgi:hypothetical protein